MSAIGQYVRHHRNLKGISQPRLADRVGCCRFSIIKIEAGRQIPRYDMVVAICTVLETPPIDLFKLISEHYERIAARPRAETPINEGSSTQG